MNANVSSSIAVAKLAAGPNYRVRSAARRGMSWLYSYAPRTSAAGLHGRQVQSVQEHWGLLPADYTRFAQPVLNDDGLRERCLHEPDIRLEGLTRSASATVSPTAVSPVMPHYRAHPYIAMVARGDPSGLG